MSIRETNYKDLKKLIEARPKIPDRWIEDIFCRDYLREINLRDARIWFRVRSRLKIRFKAHQHLKVTWTAVTVIQPNLNQRNILRGAKALSMIEEVSTRCKNQRTNSYFGNAWI